MTDQLNDLAEPLADFMENQTFKSEISQRNLNDTFQEMQRLVNPSDFTEQHIDFLLNRCEVVLFTLNDISEAFHFFELRAKNFAAVSISRPDFTFDDFMTEIIADLYEAFGLSDAIVKDITAKIIESFKPETRS